MVAKSRFEKAALGGLAATTFWTIRAVRTSMLARRLRGKRVLITGGSKGLGMILARDFALKGAQVIICARSDKELSKASGWIQKSTGSEVAAIRCDVSDANDVNKMIDQILNEIGPVDILINNASIITVAPVENFSIQDFKDTHDIVFWGTLNPTLALLPSMTRRKSGQIVNITSIGAIVGIPHLVPYSSAKFATLGLSLGLNAELRSQGISVTTIVPGLMRTGSFINAEFKGQRQKEYKWFSVASSLPFVTISAESAARKIVDAVIRKDSFRILGLPAKVAAAIYTLSPKLSLFGSGLITCLLPQPVAETPQPSVPVQGKTLSNEGSLLLHASRTLGYQAIEKFQT